MKRIILGVTLAAVCAALGGESLSLNGAWQLEGFPEPNDGAVRVLPLPGNVKITKVAATVPGNCELDLVNAGLMPEPEKGLNVIKFRPYEGWQWLYTKIFTAKRPPRDGSRAELVFDGIDTLADVFLNGEKIGEAENMHLAHRYDVTKKLRDGENTVQVLIRSVLLEARNLDVGELGFHMGLGSAENFRKAAHQFGWDIFPRLAASGLWRDVRLETSDPVTIRNVAWIFGNFDFKRRSAACKVQMLVRGPMEAYCGGYRIEMSLSRNGRRALFANRPLVTPHSIQRPGGVSGVDFWWPRGWGESALYDALIEVKNAAGETVARDARKVGIRDIELVRDDIYSEERPGQFLFKVNGEPCYVRGSNWVPLDNLHGRDRQWLVPTLEMFADLNCNMVRVWGGGTYEPDEFYDWCDANGLMVWQDFMTGCSTYPQNDRFAKLQEEEIRTIVLRHRNHPSIAIWSGNNENDGAFKWNSYAKQNRDPNLDRNSRLTIARVLFEFDVTRPYLPSSPYQSPDVFAGKAKASEDHLWGARAYYKVPFYTNSPCWFASEMGYHGAPNRASLERMMSKDCVYPWKKAKTPAYVKDDGKKNFRGGIDELDWNDEWRLKSSCPILDPTFGLWGRNNLMTNQIRLMFGGVDTDLDTFLDQSQTVQAEAMKTFCELFRADKFKKKNGLIWWNVRDGWPQISDAVVDWYGGRKKAYFALRQVQRDQLVMVRDDGRVTAVNDRRRPVKGHARIVDKASGKVLFDRDYALAANVAEDLGRVSWQGRGVLAIDWTTDDGNGHNHFLYGEPPFDWKSLKPLLAGEYE